LHLVAYDNFLINKYDDDDDDDDDDETYRFALVFHYFITIKV